MYDVAHREGRVYLIGDADGNQYTGAGDNSQRYLPAPNNSASPLSFFKVVGGPTEMGCTYPVRVPPLGPP